MLSDLPISPLNKQVIDTPKPSHGMIPPRPSHAYDVAIFHTLPP